jgi:DNA polymerase III alpha subunit
MSKFKAQEMGALQEAFVDGCKNTAGFSHTQAHTLWEQVLAFAGYGFNQGHATAYADISYRSAFIRTHWPAQFLAARLANGGGFHHPAIYMAEARRLGVTVRPPHVNHSGRKFTLAVTENEQATLWMGLSWVRSLRRSAVRQIVKQRPFTSLTDLLIKVQLQTKEIQYLIQCGALDGLGKSRAMLLQEAQQAERGQPQQLSLFAATTPPVPAETAAERVAWEKHILGFPVSTFPLQSEQPAAAVMRFNEVAQSNGRLVTVHVMRLPGWTGGRGIYIGNEQFFAVAGGKPQLLEQVPRPWQTVTLSGRWRTDQWGGEWFQIESIGTPSK